MTPAELRYCWDRNLRVRVANHDYAFSGWVVSIYHKYKAPDKVRVVIENGDGVNLIQSPKNLEFEKITEEYAFKGTQPK